MKLLPKGVYFVRRQMRPVIREYIDVIEDELENYKLKGLETNFPYLYQILMSIKKRFEDWYLELEEKEKAKGCLMGKKSNWTPSEQKTIQRYFCANANDGTVWDLFVRDPYPFSRLN